MNKFQYPFCRYDKAITIERKSAPSLYYQIVFLCPETNLTIEGEASLKLTQTILTEDINSRINAKARNKGLSYGVQSYVELCSEFCSLVIFGEVEPKNSSELFSLISDEIKSILNDDIAESESEGVK